MKINKFLNGVLVSALALHIGSVVGAVVVEDSSPSGVIVQNLTNTVVDEKQFNNAVPQTISEEIKLNDLIESQMSQPSLFSENIILYNELIKELNIMSTVAYTSKEPCSISGTVQNSFSPYTYLYTNYYFTGDQSYLMEMDNTGKADITVKAYTKDSFLSHDSLTVSAGEKVTRFIIDFPPTDEVISLLLHQFAGSII